LTKCQSFTEKVLAIVISCCKSYLMNEGYSDCDYELTPDEAYALEDAIQSREPFELKAQPVQSEAEAYVLRRFNSGLKRC